MEAVEFIKAIRQRVIESDYAVYQNLLGGADEAKDPIWKSILPVYKGLANEQQESFLKFIRLIQVNAVSHILGILDGSTYLNENKESFVLKTEAGGGTINGDLQNIFLEMEED
jgi:hypothetical protein